jgi:hypothetical protein
VPLLENTGLGVALFSYDGKLFWGFNADYELVPDLRSFVRGIDLAFVELASAAGAGTGARSTAGVAPRAAESAGSGARSTIATEPRLAALSRASST